MQQNEYPSKGGAKGLIYKFLDSALPEKFKRPSRVHSETLGAIIAGTEATANVLVTAFFNLLSNPDCLEKLQQEVDGAWPETTGPDMKALLQLPYLVRFKAPPESRHTSL